MPTSASILICVLTMLLCSPARAQDSAPGNVTGLVLYADTGKPASEINLWLEPTGPKSYMTPDLITGDYEVHDEDQRLRERLNAKVRTDGTFEIRSVPKGTYVVHTYAPHYLSPDGTVYLTNSAHTVTAVQHVLEALQVQVASDTTSRLSIRLQRGGAIEGFIRRADGSPLASDPESPYGIAVGVGRKLSSTQYARYGGAAHTDIAGHFSLDSLKPGDYVVNAGPFTATTRTAVGLVGEPGMLFYAPGTTRAADATVIHIYGTETAHTTITLPPPVALHAVTGKLEGFADTALAEAIIRLLPKNEGGLTLSIPVRGSSTFTLGGIPDGDYTVSLDFNAQAEMIRIDAERGVLYMRQRKPPYAISQEHIRVSGMDIQGVTLRSAPLSKTEAKP